MTRKNRNSDQSDSPVVAFFMGQLAAAFFAVPTAALLWFATNKYLVILWSSDVFFGSTGFWSIVVVFAVVSLFLPRLFPAFLGKVWQSLIHIERWF